MRSQSANIKRTTEAMPPQRWQGILFAVALSFWLWYWLVQRIFGPFGADDTFFLHIFWMLRGGARQYTDFYSYHLPTYFALVTPLLPSGDSLAFAWSFRVIAVLIVAGYAAMVRPILWPFVLAFVVFGRMADIRPDTFGLLLFNLAWLVLLKERRNLYLAAALSALAILFSARAAIMMVGMVPLLLWLARDNRRAMLGLFGMGAAFVMALALLALNDPNWFETVLRSVFVDTTNLFPRMPFAARLLELERLSIVAMILAALVAAVVALGRDRQNSRAQIIAAACLSQMGLIFADPLPYGYVYGWAMLPTLAGLTLAAQLMSRQPDRLLAWAGFGSAVAMLALTLSYPMRNGRPAADSYARLTPASPMTAADISRAATPQLVALTLKPHSPWTQIAVREELCRRIPGPVAVHFWYQPICARDAMHNWTGQTWELSELEQVMATNPPSLIVWGDQQHWPQHLLSGYSVYPGFALRTEPPASRP